MVLYNILFIDIGNVSSLDKYCPGLLKEIEFDDILTDDDSDGENPPEILVSNIYNPTRLKMKKNFWIKSKIKTLIYFK